MTNKMQLYRIIYYSIVPWLLYMFRAILLLITRSFQTVVTASGFTHRNKELPFSVLCSWSGRPARPQTQHGYHHDTKVKPEAATAVVELLMMGGRTTETCWAVNKRQDDKLENCCIWLVIYLNCTMMHGLTNVKQSMLVTSRCRPVTSTPNYNVTIHGTATELPEPTISQLQAPIASRFNSEEQRKTAYFIRVQK